MAMSVKPECTKKPDDCILCEFIQQIFDRFPAEKDPGCEMATEDQEVQKD